MFYIDLILNLTLLISLSIVSSFIEERWARHSAAGIILQGLLFGSAALIGMLRPLDFGNGLIFDGRSVMISLAALFYGPVAALISAGMALALRISIGGGGMIMGILVICTSAVTGLLFRVRIKPVLRPPSSFNLYLFGLTVHILMIGCMATLPENLIISTFSNMALPVLLFYPLATVLAGKILANLVHTRLHVEALKESEQKFREAIEYLPSPIGIARRDGRILHVNRSFIETYGYGLQDIPTINEWKTLAYPDPVYREISEKKWIADVNDAIHKKTGSIPREYRIHCKDKSEKEVIISIRLIGDQIITVFEDVTERNRREALLREQVRELANTREATINSMAIISEFRDTDTGAHIQRTKLYVKLLLEQLGDKAPYSPEEIELIWHSAPLHDIGKVAIPDSILLKPGKLTDEEFEEMKKHPLYGSTAIRRTEELLSENSFLNFASEIAEFHHEKWDGSGYPHGLKGENIPLSARIMAIADVYDACISSRPYKAPIPHNEVVKIIHDGAGKHFDPYLVSLFEKKHADFFRISNEYRDT